MLHHAFLCIRRDDESANRETHSRQRMRHDIAIHRAHFKINRPHDVDKAASALTRNMALFFVPASIGLMHEYKILMSNWVVLLTVSVVTTLLVIVVVGVTEERLDRKLSHKKGGEKI